MCFFVLDIQKWPDCIHINQWHVECDIGAALTEVKLN